MRRRNRGNGLIEAMQLMTAQQMALSNPQAPQKQETPLTPEQRAAKARQDNINGWLALHDKWKREATARKSY
jgi:hypothetical protein